MTSAHHERGYTPQVQSAYLRGMAGKNFYPRDRTTPCPVWAAAAGAGASDGARHWVGMQQCPRGRQDLADGKTTAPSVGRNDQSPNSKVMVVDPNVP